MTAVFLLYRKLKIIPIDMLNRQPRSNAGWMILKKVFRNLTNMLIVYIIIETYILYSIVFKMATLQEHLQKHSSKALRHIKTHHKKYIFGVVG
jgi:hypothetical protein